MLGASQEELSGWVMPPILSTHGLTENSTWDLSHCQVDDGFYLRMRVERRRVSPELVKILLSKEMFKKGAKALKKAEKKSLTEKIFRKLLSETLPTISYVDAFWRSDGAIFLASTSKNARKVFEHLFYRSIAKGLNGKLLALEPPLMSQAGYRGLEKEKVMDSIKELGKVVHSPFWKDITAPPITANYED